MENFEASSRVQAEFEEAGVKGSSKRDKKRDSKKIVGVAERLLRKEENARLIREENEAASRLEEIAHTSKQCTKKRAESSDNDSSIPYFVVIAQKKATEKSAERAKQKAAKKKTKAIKRAEQESKAVALARKLNVNEARLEGNGRRNIAFFANRDVENSSDEDSIDDSEVDCSNVAVIQGGTEEQEWPSEDEEDDTEEQEANFGVSFASKLSVQPSPLSVSSVPTNAPPVFGLDDGADDLDVEPSNLHTVSHDNAKLGENAKKESTKKMKNNKKKSKRNGGDFPVEEEEQAQAEDPKEVARRARDAKLSAKAESKKKYAAFEARMFPKLAESHPLAKRRQLRDMIPALWAASPENPDHPNHELYCAHSSTF